MDRPTYAHTFSERFPVGENTQLVYSKVTKKSHIFPLDITDFFVKNLFYFS